MNTDITESPLERMKRAGGTALSTGELLAVVLQRPDEADAVSQALEGIGVNDLLTLDMDDVRIAGWPESQRAALVASISFGLRLARLKMPERIDASTPERMVQYLLMKHGDGQFIAGAVFLDRHRKIISDREIFRGTKDKSPASPRDLLCEALRVGAHSFIFYNVHPSGKATASAESTAFYRRLTDAADQVGIELVDFLVLGRADSWMSYKEKSRLTPTA